MPVSWVQNSTSKDFPDDPVAETQRSQSRGPQLIHGQGTKSHMPLSCHSEEPAQPDK